MAAHSSSSRLLVICDGAPNDIIACGELHRNCGCRQCDSRRSKSAAFSDPLMPAQKSTGSFVRAVGRTCEHGLSSSKLVCLAFGSPIDPQ